MFETTCVISTIRAFRYCFIFVFETIHCLSQPRHCDLAWAFKMHFQYFVECIWFMTWILSYVSLTWTTKRKRLPPGIEYLSIVTVKKKKNPPYLNLLSVENKEKRNIHYSFDSEKPKWKVKYCHFPDFYINRVEERIYIFLLWNFYHHKKKTWPSKMIEYLK